MIQKESRLKVADNSGAREVLCIGVLGGTKRRFASLGDKIKVTVKQSNPKGNTKKKTVSDAVIVRVKNNVRRSDGTYVSFEDNAVVLIDKKGEMIGTRVFGPVAREVLKNKSYNKISSLAKETI